MSIWGKVLGGVGGFAVGGPIGALIGAVGGHMVDRMRAAEERPDQTDTPGADASGEGQGPTSIHSATFTLGVIVLSAKMAKADGQVTRDEINTFRRVFHIPEHEVRHVARIFDRARRDASGFEPYAQQMARLFRNRPQVLREVLWCLAEIARADGVIHESECAYLRAVADIFGFGDQATFERITGLGCGGGAVDDPYAILGVSREDTDAAIKAAHRRLVMENHPDRLMAQGVPQEFLKTANKKLARINAAWDEIRRQRARG